MVYKKITDKIPSLLSLLLAGLLLSGGCNSKKEEAKSVKEGKGKVGKNGNDKTAVDKEVDGKPLSKDSKEALKAIYSYLISDVSGISRLKQKSVFTLSPADLSGNDVVEKVEQICKKFVELPNSMVYPQALKDVFQSLTQIKFRSDGAITGLKHKAAYGRAFNEIAQVWKSFSGYTQQILALVDKGAPELEVSRLLSELEDWYEKTINGPTTHFKEGHPFCDATKVELFTGDRLARFLSSKELDDSKQPIANRYKNKKNDFDVPTLLQKSVGEVWIQGRTDEDPERFVAQGNSPNIDKLSTIRGVAISDLWEVEGKTVMPQISAFPNSKTIVGPIEGGSNTAPVQKKITFDQCITTLFNGNQSLDFISFDSDSTKDRIKVYGNNANFQQIANLAAQMNDQGYAAFATALGAHIASTQLKDLFYVPDIKKIKDTITDDMFKDLNEPFNDGGPDNQVSFKPELIKDHSNACRFLENIATIISTTGISGTTEAYKVCKELVDNDTDYKNFLKSGQTIEKKIAVKVIKAVMNDEEAKLLLVSNQRSSTGKFVKKIEEFIKTELENAVVYMEGGTYKATRVSKDLQIYILEMVSSLNKKLKGASITYKDIESNVKGFDIKKVVAEMHNDYKAIRSILRARVRPFVAEKSAALTSENYKLYFPDQKLIFTQVEHINNINVSSGLG